MNLLFVMFLLAGATPDASSIVQRLTVRLENQPDLSTDAVLHNIAICEKLLSADSSQVKMPEPDWVEEHVDRIGSIFSTDQLFIMFSGNDPTSDFKSCTIVTQVESEDTVLKQLSQKFQTEPLDVDEKDRPSPSLRWLIEANDVQYYLGSTISPKSNFKIVVAKKKIGTD